MEEQQSEYPFDFGPYELKISTKNSKAQVWFNRALAQDYGYNHEETIFCCDKAIEFDSTCGIIYALKAFATGINYNNCPEKITEQQAKNQFEAWQLANKYRENTDIELEKDIIDALKFRVGDGVTLTHKQQDQEFADALKEVYYKYEKQNDLSIEAYTFLCAIVAEANMCLRPWKLWSREDNDEYKYGDPFHNTLFIQEVLEKGLKVLSTQPGLRHLWLHFMELSSTPEKALCTNFSTYLKNDIPASGHLCHMPSHVEIQCGQYVESIDSNVKGIEADEKYYAYRRRENKKEINFYQAYRVHNYHFLIWAAMFAGRYQDSIKYSEQILDICTKNQMEDTTVFVPSGAFWLEGFVSVGIHVLIRFGKWEELISETPLGEKLPVSEILKNKELYSSTLATVYYGRGMAYAVLAGKVDGKREEYLNLALENQKLFLEQYKTIKDSRIIFQVKLTQLLEVGEYMLAGEILYRQEKYDEAFKNLKIAVEKDDNLPYNEPWGWMVPARHALGALLLEQGIVSKNKELVEEAEQVYRRDLGEGCFRYASHQDNVWSLIGLNLCYKFLEKTKEIEELKPKLESRLKDADLNINASCLCSVKKITV